MSNAAVAVLLTAGITGLSPMVATAASASTGTKPPTVATKPGMGKALLERGDTGSGVTFLQVRLQKAGFYDFPATGKYGKETSKALVAFQKANKIAATGRYDQATKNALKAKTGKVTSRQISEGENFRYSSTLDKRCRTGRVLCIDKTSHTLRFMIDGKVKMTLDTRFGSAAHPTREGQFSVYWKDRDHVSDLYGSSMPYAMFFSGGQAVHYSSDFAARGYYGASHGCVNIRQKSKLISLYNKVHTGDKVVVYRSKAISG